LYFESRLAEKNWDELADSSVETLWLILPEPVLKYFDIKLKKELYQYTMGDFLFYQVTGAKLDGYKTGSLFAHGMGLFGWFFTVVYFLICLALFWILDLLANKNRGGHSVTSVVGALLIWHVYLTGITSDSFNATLSILFRQIPQSILIFVVVYQISRVLTYLDALMQKNNVAPTSLRS
jgi:cellulose synthase/poly-beta-1,6-N-acetylglucosamine synthase-like glycosyltransferase